MRAAVQLALSGLWRAPARTLVRIAILAAATALLGGMLLFVGNSLRTMSGSSVRGVPLDWQGPVPSFKQATNVAKGVGRQPGVQQASATATAPLSSSAHGGPSGNTTGGSGGVLAVPQDYLTHLNTFRILQGSLRPGEIVLDQQMASTLQANLGDTVSLSPKTGVQHSYKVSGVAVVTSPDKLFQPLNPQAGPAPAQPPANIAIMPTDTFAATYAPGLRTITAASPGQNAQPGAQDGVQWQVQAQLDPLPLSAGSPNAALDRAGQTRNRVERSLPGQVQFVDNLSETLTTAAGDALYAETLYIMLAVPGALIALGLAYLAALGTVERDRRDLALLRARGATRNHLLALATSESLVLGIVAGLLGAGLAFLAVSQIVAGGAHLTVGRAITTGLACVFVGILGAGVARIGANARVFRQTIAAGRRSTARETKPLWQRFYLDVAALAISGLIYWLTASTGFSAVVNPDSNPTLSLSVYMFFAPALLWIGATLLLVRLRGRALATLARRAAGDRAATTRGFLLASAGRRGAAINRGLVVVGLLLAFGVNLGIFAATYNQQANVDAQLTLGADVTVAAAPGAIAQKNLEQKVRSVRGVEATSAVDHSYAYVGPDLQDTYGVDANKLPHATTLRDSYFIGASANDSMRRLARTRDGILVSKETIKDYSLKLGDLLKLRVLDRVTGRFGEVKFHVQGVVQEFPSAPKDSFMIANIGYLQAASHAQGPNVIFAKSPGDPSAVAGRVATAVRSDGAQVKNIREQTARTVSSITTVDLRGISRIEEAFAVLLAAGAMALFVALALAERRQEFATMAALGGSLREIGAFLWTEAAIVLGAAIVLAIGLGWLLSEMLIAMLQHVFDPPPDALAIPWGFLLALVGAAILATLVAIGLVARGLGRLRIGELLRER